MYLLSAVAWVLFLATIGTIVACVTAPKRRSLRAVEHLRHAKDGEPVVVFGHDPYTGRGMSTPMFAADRTVGTLARLVGLGQLQITAIEPFDRGEPRHVQSLRGALAVLDLEIAERGASRVDAVSLRTPGVDDIIRLANHWKLHKLASEHGLLTALVTDGSRTLAMPAFSEDTERNASA